MADKYTIVRDGKKWQIVDVKSGVPAKRNLSKGAAIDQCKTLNDQAK
jgi:hypothetical protein